MAYRDKRKNRKRALAAYHDRIAAGLPVHTTERRNALMNTFRKALRLRADRLESLGQAAQSVVRKYNRRMNSKLLRALRRRYEKIYRGQLYSKSERCRELIGCSLDELRAHLEKQFKPGMNWDNWSFRGWHIDHIKALCQFDLTDPSQEKAAFHYTNLQPLWAKENLTKRFDTAPPACEGLA